VVHLRRRDAQKFYQEHIGKPFFERLIDYMTSGASIALILQKVDAVKAWRTLIGPTDHEEAKKIAPKSLRALYGETHTFNAVHGSESVRAANIELAVMFKGTIYLNYLPPQIMIGGATASGKGTQCERIVGKWGVKHISTGDLLRQAAQEGTPLGLEAKVYMDEGKLVPDALMINLVIDTLKSPICQERGWLLDGFPRTREQAVALTKAGFWPDTFILIDVPDNILVERVVGRRTDPVTGVIYHLKFKPPPDDIFPRLSQRSDDTEVKISTRIAAFHNNISSIGDFYQDVLVRIDGNQGMEHVFQYILQEI